MNGVTQNPCNTAQCALASLPESLCRQRCIKENVVLERKAIQPVAPIAST